MCCSVLQPTVTDEHARIWQDSAIDTGTYVYVRKVEIVRLGLLIVDVDIYTVFTSRQLNSN